MRVGGKMAIVLLASNLVMLLLIVVGSLVIPPAPDTNRKIRVPGSRFAEDAAAGRHRVRLDLSPALPRRVIC